MLKIQSPLVIIALFFEGTGELYILRGTSRKKISYKPVYFKSVGKKGDYILFELKIICDFPYFSDSADKNVDIYKRIDKVSGAFKLPKVFTERVTSADIMNVGQVRSEPVITLECTGEGVFSGGIHIKNESTGKSLVINKNMLNGEIIVLDVKNRIISSNMREKCYGMLSGECALSEFFLEKGMNCLVLENENDGETVRASIFFENLYTGAM